MSAVLKQRIIVRRFKYLANRYVYDGPHRHRITRSSIQPLHPSQIRKQRNFVRLGGIISSPIDLPPPNYKYSFGFEDLKKLFLKRADGNGDKNGNDKKEDRDLEVKKLQNLRQRSIDHIYDQESVWKSMKERDELLRRDENKDREKENSEKDDSK